MCSRVFHENMFLTKKGDSTILEYSSILELL